ncbi:S8 family serine peptidase [Micromonospora sp. 4G57]|uniref:S8 family serine peptidase n=1 Tax=Micromonospora sicca TaxID=2202420 RepID=A0ABU5J9E1_9ACTN|nr:MULTISPECIES: S8 family serine peptidase [unclassified Micromonospora]MDZ5441950.1 S8 family serine peptidase [Micromonospora sp. 4G57]MDZ5489197.1 S8 family serine peptidase [Micromonospora sp. 4G53]
MGAAALCALIAVVLPVGPARASQQDGASRIRSDQWHLRYLRVAEAHRLSQGDGVIVAIPDTGVDQHPDLSGNLLSGIDVIPGGSGDGRRDLNGHGTGMAGLIAAGGQGGNRGALGIAPRARILPILVTPATGEGEADALAEGITYAMSHGAKVISISSVGGSGERLIKALDAAIASDIVIVASAGNRPEDSGVGYPASEDRVIAVGGTDRKGNHAALSVTGREIDVVAPAVDMYSTGIDGKYRKGTGTSDATAIVAGAAALIRSRYPYLPAAEVAHRLTATAIDKGPPGRDDEYGYGLIDLVAALTADVPPLGFESAAPSASTTTTAAEPASDGGDGGATARGLATLGVLVAAGGGYLLWRRRRRADDPPPRISR